MRSASSLTKVGLLHIVTVTSKIQVLGWHRATGGQAHFRKRETTYDWLRHEHQSHWDEAKQMHFEQEQNSSKRDGGGS